MDHIKNVEQLTYYLSEVIGRASRALFWIVARHNYYHFMVENVPQHIQQLGGGARNRVALQAAWKAKMRCIFAETAEYETPSKIPP